MNRGRDHHCRHGTQRKSSSRNRLATHGILVNHIVPGGIEKVSAGTPRNPPEKVDRNPVGRRGWPEEIAAICGFLPSEEAAYITGQTIHVNGGEYTY